MVKKIKWVGTLSTTERNNIGLIQVRQNNVNSEVLGFNIVDGNGEPYDLKNRKVLFCTYFDKLAPVEQYAEVIENGKIIYTMNEHDMQKPVRINFAYFKIMDEKDNLVDTTQNFSYDIMPSIESKCGDFGPYIIRLEEVLDAFLKINTDAKKELEQIIIDFNEQVINQQQNFDLWFESIREILESVDPGGVLLSELVESRGGFEKLADRLNENDLKVSGAMIYTGLKKSIRKMIDRDNVKVIAVGDSTTLGAGQIGTDENAKNNYPEILQNNLRNIYRNNNIIVENQGRGGWTTEHWVKDNRLDLFVLDKKPDLVILMLGFNDVHLPSTLEQYLDNLRNLVYRIQKSGADLILCSPPISFRKEFYGKLDVNETLKQFADGVQYVAESTNTMFIDIHSEMNDLIYKYETYVPSEIFGMDKIHMTDYQPIADIILKNMQGNTALNITDATNIPAVGSVFLDTNCDDTYTLNLRDARYGWIYGGNLNQSSKKYFKLKLNILKKNMNLAIQHAITNKLGIVSIYDNGVLINKIDMNNFDANYESVICGKYKTIANNLSQGYHEILIETDHLEKGSSISDDYYLTLEGFKVYEDKGTTTNNIATYLKIPANQRVSQKIGEIEKKDNKDLLISILGRFKNNTACLLFASGNLAPLNLTILNNKIVLIESFSTGGQGRKFEGVSTLDISKKLDIEIIIRFNKISVYVNEKLEIDHVFEKKFNFSGNISLFAYDSTNVTDISIFNMSVIDI